MIDLAYSKRIDLKSSTSLFRLKASNSDLPDDLD